MLRPITRMTPSRTRIKTAMFGKPAVWASTGAVPDGTGDVGVVSGVPQDGSQRDVPGGIGRSYGQT